MFIAAMDPPWHCESGGGGRGANSKYRLATVAAICRAILESGAWPDDTSDALVWMWATSRALMLGHAFDLTDRLGIEPVSSFVWNKVHPQCARCGGLLDSPSSKKYDGMPACACLSPTYGAPRPGIGQWQRTEHEHLLLCRRGNVQIPPFPSRQRSTIYAPRHPIHSRKPEKAWRVIEETSKHLATTGVEFFAREPRRSPTFSWGAWGHIDGEDKPPRFLPPGGDP